MKIFFCILPSGVNAKTFCRFTHKQFNFFFVSGILSVRCCSDTYYIHKILNDQCGVAIDNRMVDVFVVVGNNILFAVYFTREHLYYNINTIGGTSFAKNCMKVGSKYLFHFCCLDELGNRTNIIH